MITLTRCSITCAVPKAASFNPMQHKGALKVASPLEIPHAMWKAMHRDVSSDQVAPSVLTEWYVQACSCAVTFKVIEDPADIMMYQDNYREQLVMTGKVVNHTGFQRIMKVVACFFNTYTSVATHGRTNIHKDNQRNWYKQDTSPTLCMIQKNNKVVLGKPVVESKMGEGILSNARYAQVYNEFITFSPSTEAMTQTFVKQAMSAYQRAFKVKKILDVVAELDRFGEESCFFRVAVIHAAANKASGARDLIELFEYIAYLQKKGQIDISSFSNDKLHPKGGKKGTLDFIVAKINMRRYMLDVWLATVAVPDTTKATIRANLTSPAAYTSAVSPYPGDVQPTLAWMKDMRFTREHNTQHWRSTIAFNS